MLSFAGCGSRHVVGRQAFWGARLRRQRIGSFNSMDPSWQRQCKIQRRSVHVFPAVESAATQQHQMAFASLQYARCGGLIQTRHVHGGPLSTSSFYLRTNRGSRGYHTHTKLKAKSRVGAPSDAKNPTDARQPQTAGKDSQASSTTSIQPADVAKGTRVRLRDTGRLGTVVGKKAGGWWIVDLAEGWASAIVGDGNGIPSARSSRNVSTVSSSSSTSSISTRRLNMEPLGDAYAASSMEEQRQQLLEIPTVRGDKPEEERSTVQRKTSRSGGGGADSRASQSTRNRATSPGAVIAAPVEPLRSAVGAPGLPSVLQGQTISVNPMSTAELTMIHHMSGEGSAHADMKEWLVFSDLHVSPGSLAVCLEALDRVNEEAIKRSACGIAFLGDFWHARGSLKVDLLVPVMERLATWTRPVVMIPGNHDQVTLGGGMHSLTPLQFAFSDPKQALVISAPTVFLDALWIPHHRNNTAMEALLASDEARGARAIFCHVDIKGAAMNDGVSSHAGIPRSAFPKGVPTFSGHFHKPHAVGDGFVRYVGSPYQTSLSESGQSKALLVLDAESWEEKEAIPINIGRRFFRVRGDDQPLPSPEEILPGDRVVWTVKDAGLEEVRRRAETLVKEGVEVEIREAPRPFPILAASRGLVRGLFETAGRNGNSTGNSTAIGSVPDSASLSPDALFRTYLEREREGGRVVAEEVERLGFKLIEDLGQAPVKQDSGRQNRHTSLELHSIQLKNFGPFRDEVTYPLDDRGVVLLKGSNLDDSGADSNGSGKTTLAMSALWALAGVVDARPVSDGRVADVVHEGTRALAASVSTGESDSGKSSATAGTGGAGGTRRSTVAEATLTGMLNGKPLWLKRRKGSRVNQLFLKHDGADLTRQVAKETQVVLEEELGLSPHVLVRGVFQGQHHMNGLLESTDAQLKEELALLVPMDLWQEVASRSRAMSRKGDEDAARFRERAITRREDLARLTGELERARGELANRTADRSANCSATESVLPQGTETVIRHSDDTKGSKSSEVGLRDSNTNAARVSDVAVSTMHNASGNSNSGGAPERGAEEGVERGRRDARQARNDAEAADETLRGLRTEFEGSIRQWTEQRFKIVGEAKAAQERRVFINRDAEKALLRYREAEAAATRVKRETGSLRKSDPDMWDTLQKRYRDASIGDVRGQIAGQPFKLESDIEEAEARVLSSRAALADARAALKYASEAVQGHRGLAMNDEGECYTCGQPVNGRMVRERGELLVAEESVATKKVAFFEGEVSVDETILATAKANAGLWKEMSRAFDGVSAAVARVTNSAVELETRRAELSLVEQESAKAKEEVDALQQRETLLRREWVGKMKAAEWALQAYRDKQILADHELATAVAREAESKLQHEKQQAERLRLLHAEEVAGARVREIEAAAERVRDELADVEGKEREASSLKTTSAALAEHLGVRGVQNFVFRDAVNQLQANVARYLDVLSDGALQLQLSMDGDRVVKKAIARAADGGFRDRSLSQLSGGQWRRSSLALELAFAELARQRSRFSCNILILDEVLSQLDAYGRARVAAMLRALAHGRAADDESGLGATQAMYSTILVVLQDLPAEELQESFDSIDQVVKHRDCSSVVVDGFMR